MTATLLSRKARSLALAALALPAAVLSGCQSYTFSPVNACLIQPGQKGVTLSSAGAADVLFVVDDSGSMQSKQQRLAQNFASFVDAVASAQKDRVAHGLSPFELHLAVTTSSVFRNYSVGSTGFSTRFENILNSGCTQGLAVAGGSYPQGDFVAAGSNARVLHFGRSLDWASWGTATPDPALASLVRQFVGTLSAGVWSGGNVEVGSCGSGEEQHLQAGSLALQKALAGQQPGVALSEFPHLGAKLVVVYVGDEDDCSSSAVSPLVLTGDPGNDSCVADKYEAAADQKLTRVQDFADYLGSLLANGQAPTPARPYVALGAAFIVASAKCTDGTYVPADACVPVGAPVAAGVCPYAIPASCGSPAPTVCSDAFAAGVRFLQFADLLRSSGSEVVQASVCEPFGPVLAGIAELVRPPLGLRLPTVPAASEVTIIQILDTSGKQRKVCPQAVSAAQAATAGWWFVSCDDRQPTPAVQAAPTACVFINHASGACEANPGETYSARYLGEVPAGGCIDPTSDGSTPSADCATKLGGTASSWSCYRPASVTTGNGSCTCR